MQCSQSQLIDCLGLPAASQRDPVDSNRRLNNLLGGDHWLHRRPRTLLAGEGHRGGDPALERGDELVAGEEKDQLEEKVSAKGRHQVIRLRFFPI